VVFIENDAVPFRVVHPLVLGLDPAGAWVLAQVVLKRPEADDRLLLVGLFERESAGADELPADEIHVALHVLFPRALHRGLEGQHQNPTPAHALGQLVRGERLAEAHLRVPEEMRRLIVVLSSPALEIHRREFDGLRLLRAHLEVPVALVLELLPAAQRGDCGPHVALTALEPLAR